MSSPVTIQPSTIDTRLGEASPTTNYATATTLPVLATTSARSRNILKFNFSAVVPAGATITLATLSLFCTISALSSRTITVYRLLRTDWVENQATWNSYKTGSSWGAAGALNTTDNPDITTTDAATATSVTISHWLNVTVTAQVQTARDSVSGVAHFLVADIGATASVSNTYSSRENTTTGNRPKLYIEYTPSSVSGASFLLRMI